MGEEPTAVSPCPSCGDSGYAETYHGGIWTGENLSTSYSICACECGESLREELAARSKDASNG